MKIEFQVCTKAYVAINSAQDVYGCKANRTIGNTSVSTVLLYGSGL